MPSFQQYVAGIGKGLDMPYDNRDEQLRIFCKVLQLASFTQKLGQPKVSNWFAWSVMANTRICESNAAKCIYASLCVNDADPDEDGTIRQRVQGSEGTAAGDIQAGRWR